MDQAIRTDLGVRKFAYRQIGRKCYRQKGVEVSQQQLTGEAPKVTGDYFFDDVHSFVMKHKDRMPREALRYTIEKWPRIQRQQAMEKA